MISSGNGDQMFRASRRSAGMREQPILIGPSIPVGLMKYTLVCGDRLMLNHLNLLRSLSAPKIRHSPVASVSLALQLQKWCGHGGERDGKCYSRAMASSCARLSSVSKARQDFCGEASRDSFVSRQERCPPACRDAVALEPFRHHYCGCAHISGHGRTGIAPERDHVFE